MQSWLKKADRERIEARIGYRFCDHDNLVKALTHASTQNHAQGNYERLEFLGDRVLGLCVAELLFETFPAAGEGELSVRLNQLVSAEACANVADELELHGFIRTGADVKRITSKRLLNIRADVVESLIAAVYLDGGLEAARALVRRFWTTRAMHEEAARRDAKTELQEWTHAQFGVTPVYRVAQRSGPDHDPLFTVTVDVQGLDPQSGSERSKRAAEQAAATRMLIRQGVWQDPDGA